MRCPTVNANAGRLARVVDPDADAARGARAGPQAAVLGELARRQVQGRRSREADGRGPDEGR